MKESINKTESISSEVVDIIILNYNNWKDTIECLHSVLCLKDVSYNVIVVDNNSSDNSCENIIAWIEGKIETTLPDFLSVDDVLQKPIEYTLLDAKSLAKANTGLVIIRSDANYGYAGGNNIGLRYSVKYGNYYQWIINNDVLVSQQSLKTLIDCFKSNESFGLLGSKLYYYHDPSDLQGVGGVYNKYTGVCSHVKDTLSVIDYPIGASIFTCARFINEVGYMCEDYFLYYEEIDWALRAKKAGYLIDYCKESVIYHKEGATTGINHTMKTKSELSDYYSLRNRLVFSKKYFPMCLPVVYLGFIVVLLNRLKRLQFRRMVKICRIMVTHQVNL